ncbi:MAG: SUMF1/EgtB/PvdO family nonheme iron enzyme, partial [Acidobacteria bacterium]|nr:SUMF1/EgtB/PvdO family nonheme iron enzyme [Acidobacteriota bacterium]
MLIRREFIRAALGGLSAVSVRPRLKAQPDAAGTIFDADLIPAPDDPREWPAFRERLAQWRERKRAELRYDDRLYRRADLQWAATSFACCFVMLCDEEFYSVEQARYLIQAWIEAGERDFGGYDSLVLWHAYPRIGVDDRNQFDMYRDMPGGWKGLRSMIELIHRMNVKAYVDYNPWDTGTRREGKSDIDALAELVGAIDADGIFLDTLSQGAAEFRARLDGTRPGVVLEGEIALPLTSIHDHHLSWAQGFRDSRVPGILRNKWFERRHMQHQIRRWHHDHTAELHTAWMNGSGVMVWENVFGSWVGWNPRDRSILRLMLPVQRRFASLFTGEHWTPLVETEAAGVYAGLWEGDGMRLWTLVNRAEKTVAGPLLKVEARGDEQVLDLIGGKELKPAAEEGRVLLEGSIGPRGIGCFLAGPAGVRREGDWVFLANQAANAVQASRSVDFPARQTVLRPPPAVKPAATVPEGMVAIDAVDYDRESVYRIRECGQLTSMDYVPGRGHERIHTPAFIRRKARLARYAIDLTPVTNAAYAKFLQSSGYRPRHPENFLKHWEGSVPPAGKEDHPVVYVDLEDARAYASWAGKRLPTELEWQYAAEGPEGLLYPWGNEMKPGLCNSGRSAGTTPVKAFPSGRSPFGCYDMCGNTWEWTESEYSDGRTRFAVLKGGSWYKAQGSKWYTDGGPQAGR